MGNSITCVMSVDGKLVVAECSLARKKAECEILIAERKALMAQLESASDTSGMEGDWAKEKAALQARVKELEAMIKKLESRLQDMESQLAQCKRDAANNAAGKDEAARLAALLAKCEGRNKQLEQELSRTAGQLQAAENTTNMIRMELGGMRAVVDEKDRHIRELQDQLRKVTQEKDSLLKAQLSAAQLALDHVSIGPQPYDLYRKEYAGDYLMRHRSEFYTAYKRL